MKQIKNIPNWMCHTNFNNLKLNGSDINLFYILIYITSKTYNDYKVTTANYSVKEIKEALNSSADIKQSLLKLNNLQINVNILKSYTIENMKEEKTITPFSIVCQKNDSNKITYIEITVDRDFIIAFENPNPKFTLSFRYLKNIKNIQAQLLYIFLADRIAKMEMRTRYIDLILHPMNEVEYQLQAYTLCTE